MAGIYVHIPFCKQICHYCDFHKELLNKEATGLIETLCKEVQLQKDYLDGETISTIYFGGGTPSILQPEQIIKIYDTISKYANFQIS